MNSLKFLYLLFIIWGVYSLSCCSLKKNIHDLTDPLPERPEKAMTGSEFLNKALALDPETRESLIEKEIKAGNFPEFMRQFVRIYTSIATSQGKKISAYYDVAPDYLMIGNDDDFFRMPMQPGTAQKIADEFGCFLSTKKICDDVYKAATVKLDPYPLQEDRDSLKTFYLHHQLIEKQRKNRKGLIAGIKKDVIITSAINRDNRPHRLALYGWHKPDGKPIQPVYTGHVDWYVDYSHGIRLVKRTIYVEGKPMDYIDVLKDPELRFLLCDEDGGCDFFGYPF